MIEYAEFDFKLSTPDKDGIPLREHLEAVERQIGRRPKELDGPPFPILMEHVWSAFLDLSGCRSWSDGRAEAITYSQIKDWKELTETPFSAQDVMALIRLDKTYLRVVNGRH